MENQHWEHFSIPENILTYSMFASMCLCGLFLIGNVCVGSFRDFWGWGEEWGRMGNACEGGAWGEDLLDS